MNGSVYSLSDNVNWTWASKSAEEVMWRNCTNCAAVHDPGVKLLRRIIEVWLTVPIVLLGIAGNVVAFVVLCHHRRHKLQTTTVILQVISHHSTPLMTTYWPFAASLTFTVLILTFLRATSLCRARYMLSPLSVSLSVTRMDQSKTVEVRIMQLSPQSSSVPLVFAI